MHEITLERQKLGPKSLQVKEFAKTDFLLSFMQKLLHWTELRCKNNARTTYT